MKRAFCASHCSTRLSTSSVAPVATSLTIRLASTHSVIDLPSTRLSLFPNQGFPIELRFFLGERTQLVADRFDRLDVAFTRLALGKPLVLFTGNDHSLRLSGSFHNVRHALFRDSTQHFTEAHTRLSCADCLRHLSTHFRGFARGSYRVFPAPYRSVWSTATASRHPSGVEVVLITPCGTGQYTPRGGNPSINQLMDHLLSMRTIVRAPGHRPSIRRRLRHHVPPPSGHAD